ncbi:MAG: hypothetical protein M1608_05155, partial [Candidatus Omnitrophica bacterium]|nr:hypothetical protein [Candidatus Omnitrophota bacterium]
MPESNFDLDLHFLPAWAQQSPAVNRFADFVGEAEDRFERPRPGRDRHRDRREHGPHRERSGDSPRAPFAGRDGARGDRGPQGGPRRRRDEERRQTPMVLPELELAILPDEKGVESLARHIKHTGLAYPLFEIGHLILKKPERYNVRFSVINKPDGQPAQPLFVCSLDETLWLSENEAVDHVLSRHFSTFYQTERIATDPPRGVFTFVAQCGMSGTILGPPNYHDYQSKLHKLHAERFSHIPFEVYKARVKIVRDEAVVKQWQEDQSWRAQYICLNVPETLKLGSREEVEKHFREVHLAHVIQSVPFFALSGVAARALPSQPLHALARRAWEEQRRFPLKVVNALSQMFSSLGLQFFKVNKTVTHVAVSRPHYLDLNVTPVSEGIKSIIHFINLNPNTNRRKLIEALAPPSPNTPADAAPVTLDATVAQAVGVEPAQPTAEMTAVIRDLHWLIHQGHVIEFANGMLEIAKPPPPKPVRAPDKALAPEETIEEPTTKAETDPGNPTSRRS